MIERKKERERGEGEIMIEGCKIREFSHLSEQIRSTKGFFKGCKIF